MDNEGGGVQMEVVVLTYIKKHISINKYQWQIKKMYYYLYGQYMNTKIYQEKLII